MGFTPRKVYTQDCKHRQTLGTILSISTHFGVSVGLACSQENVQRIAGLGYIPLIHGVYYQENMFRFVLYIRIVISEKSTDVHKSTERSLLVSNCGISLF